MNSKVRNLFRNESKDIESFTNFNQVYFVFEQMVEYDIDIPEIEGLQERLPYALNKIATEKLDRNDVLTYFPIIWGKFEQYARKVLFIIDPNEYAKIKANKNSSLVDVLGKLGIRVFVQKQNRTNTTDAIYTAYNLRNTEAHKCEKWSLRKCYDKMAKVMTAYMVVTNKVLPKLEMVMKSVPDEKKIRVIAESRFRSINADIFDARFTIPIFFNLNDYFSLCSRVYDSRFNTYYYFNREGWVVSSKSLQQKYGHETTYTFDIEEQKIVRRKATTSFAYDRETDETEFKKYTYDDENRITRIENYDVDGPNGKSMPRYIFEIEYLTDGNILITRKRIMRQTSFNERKTGEKFEIRVDNTTMFDEMGRMIQRNGANYLYSENGSLIRIEYPNNSFDDIRIIGNNMFMRHRKKEGDEGFIKEKRLYSDGKLRKITIYKAEDRSGRKPDCPEIQGEYEIEYFDEEK